MQQGEKNGIKPSCCDFAIPSACFIRSIEFLRRGWWLWDYRVETRSCCLNHGFEPPTVGPRIQSPSRPLCDKTAFPSCRVTVRLIPRGQTLSTPQRGCYIHLACGDLLLIMFETFDCSCHNLLLCFGQRTTPTAGSLQRTVSTAIYLVLFGTKDCCYNDLCRLCLGQRTVATMIPVGSV